MYPIDVLHHIYHFPHRDLPSSQDETSCIAIAKIFKDFCSSFSNYKDLVLPSCGYTQEEVTKAIKYITEGSEQSIYWLPKYGCAMLFRCTEKLVRTGYCTIYVVGVDDHKHEVHVGGKGYQFSSLPCSFASKYVGELKVDEKAKFLERFKDLMRKASERHGDERSAAGGNQGHQKTPAWIHALAVQALKCKCIDKDSCSCKMEVSKGGFTDVGLHTGGCPTNTEFALVRSVFHHLLGDHDCSETRNQNFDVLMVQFYLFILQQEIKDDVKNKSHAEDDLFFMFQVCAVQSASLVDFDYNISMLRDKLEGILKSLKNHIVLKNQSLLAKNKLNIEIRSHHPPVLKIPDAIEAQLECMLSKEEIMTNIQKNTGLLFHSIDSAMMNIQDASTWAKEKKNSYSKYFASSFYFLRQIEKVFWYHGSNTLSKMDPLPISDLEHVHDLVICYQFVLDRIRDSAESVRLHDMRTRMLSVELLIVWMAYCITFESILNYHTEILQGYGVCLRFQDMKHLLIEFPEHANALNLICRYLSEHTVDGRDIFSKRDDENWNSPTFTLAHTYSTKFLLDTLEKCKQKDNQRVKDHWDDVLEKKTKAKKLRNDIQKLNKEIYDMERKCKEANNFCTKKYLKTQLNKLHSERNSTQSTLDEVIKAPEPVIQPLPHQVVKALKVLFFIRMPQEFNILSKLSFMAQEMLISKPMTGNCDGIDGTKKVNLEDYLKVSEDFISWHEHYKQYQKDENYAESTVFVSMMSRVPNIQTKNVEFMFSDKDDVWYPDDCGIRLAWFRGSNPETCKNVVEINPFAVQESHVAAYFTEKLHCNDKSLQWSLLMQPFEKTKGYSTHGNKPYASLSSKPTWLTKEGYLKYTSMRRYPLIALRNLCNTLHSGSLPLHQSAVESLIRQTLFHVGELSISTNNQIQFHWRQNIEGIHHSIASILPHLVDEYKEKPSNYRACYVLAEISAYLSTHISTASKSVLLTLKNVLAMQALKWAREYGDMAKNATPDCVSSIRSQQVIFFWSASICAVYGELDDTALQILVESIVGAHNVFVKDDDETLSERHQLEFLSQYFLADKISIYRAMLLNKSSILTYAIKSVIQSAPSVIEWDLYEHSCTSFIGTTRTEDYFYSIDVFTGVVLVNGLPPKQLPRLITDDTRYKKCFGSNNFEVVLKNGIYETIHPIEDCFYRFYKVRGHLVVLELPTGDSTSSEEVMWDEALELLDSEMIHSWGEEVPVYLQHSFSHCISRKEGRIFFRGHSFSNRSIYYVHDTNRCFKIANHFHGTLCPSDDLKNNLDLVLLTDTPFLDLLEKLDQRNMIHVYRIPSDSDTLIFKVSFLRFSLDFTLSYGTEPPTLLCDQIQGYHLHPVQHVAGSFSRLSQYLVLQSVKDPEQIKIIVPFGCISHSNSNSVEIKLIDTISTDGYKKEISNGFNQRMKYFIYDRHPRFLNLTSSSICSRLYLAAIYTACNSVIPDQAFFLKEQNQIGAISCSFELLTGEEKAVQLLRQSWINRPLSAEESYILENIKNLSMGKYPSISIMCHDLMKSSLEMSFLYNNLRQETIQWNVDELSDEISAYHYFRSIPHSKRILMSPDEVTRIAGLSKEKAWRHSRKFVSRNVNVPDVDLNSDSSKRLVALLSDCGCVVSENSYIDISNLVKSLHDILAKECHQQNRQIFGSKDGSNEFPLNMCSQTNLNRQVEDELKRSWEIHCDLRSVKLVRSQNAIQIVNNVLKAASMLRQVIQEYLIDHLNFGSQMRSTTHHWHLDAQYLYKMSNIIPLANLTDLASIAMDKALVRCFNPLLSDESINMLHRRTLDWLELCVLEDKCHTLLLFEHDEAAFLTESRSTRKWDTAKHPYWLVFEAEQQIRIRSEQYAVANHLIDIDNTGSIVQLNMGLGKTRVVLPMIILYFCFNFEKKHVKHTPRLCILSTLLNEACEYYQKVLCASTIGRRLFLCPFRRDVELTPDRIQLMLDMIYHCETQNGFIVLAPEHRLSLELKVKELEISGEAITCQSLLKEVKSRKYFDIFDEVDEILHHRFQLVYSMGTPSPLPEGNRRWEVSAGLLQVLQQGKINSITFTDDSKYPEKFKDYILADDMDPLLFRNQLANCLLEKPPLPLDWLSLLKTEQKQVVHKVITDHKSDPTILNLRVEEHMQDILMLRGLLAEDIFLHCLHKRHRIDYGINPQGRKRLSVPFRGADLPSQRAEFAHPDCAIVLTHLSYFYSGLTIEQIISTFDLLLNLGMGAKESLYEAWFAQSKKKIQEGNFDGASIRKVNQIDLSNRSQLLVLHQVYHKNPLTIHFWLRSCVFSTELDSYPRRLSSNAWHLANNEDGMADDRIFRNE